MSEHGPGVQLVGGSGLTPLVPTPNRKLVNAITSRSAEALARPSALAEFAATLHQAATFHAQAKANDTLALKDGADARFTGAELDAFEKLFRERGVWVDEMRKRQDKVGAHEDPAFRVADVDRKAREIGEERRRLERKKAPRRKRVASSSAAAETPVAEETPKVQKAEGEL